MGVTGTGRYGTHPTTPPTERFPGLVYTQPSG